jgi:hypothetical protein
MTVARGVLLVLLAAAVGAAVWVAGGMLLHLDEPAYRLGPVRVVVVLAAALAILMGARALARSTVAGITLLALFTAVFAVFTVLPSSLSILALPLLVLCSALLGWRARRQRGHTAGALGAAFLVALGLGAMLLAEPYTALVRCLPNGVSTSSRLFESNGSSSSESGSGSASLDPAVGATGMVDSGGVQYSYTCRDGKLTDFRRVG